MKQIRIYLLLVLTIFTFRPTLAETNTSQTTEVTDTNNNNSLGITDRALVLPPAIDCFHYNCRLTDSERIDFCGVVTELSVKYYKHNFNKEPEEKLLVNGNENCRLFFSEESYNTKHTSKQVCNLQKETHELTSAYEVALNTEHTGNNCLNIYYPSSNPNLKQTCRFSSPTQYCSKYIQRWTVWNTESKYNFLKYKGEEERLHNYCFHENTTKELLDKKSIPNIQCEVGYEDIFLDNYFPEKFSVPVPERAKCLSSLCRIPENYVQEYCLFIIEHGTEIYKKERGFEPSQELIDESWQICREKTSEEYYNSNNHSKFECKMPAIWASIEKIHSVQDKSYDCTSSDSDFLFPKEAGDLHRTCRVEDREDYCNKYKYSWEHYVDMEKSYNAETEEVDFMESYCLYKTEKFQLDLENSPSRLCSENEIEDYWKLWGVHYQESKMNEKDKVSKLISHEEAVGESNNMSSSGLDSEKNNDEPIKVEEVSQGLLNTGNMISISFSLIGVMLTLA